MEAALLVPHPHTHTLYLQHLPQTALLSIGAEQTIHSFIHSASTPWTLAAAQSQAGTQHSCIQSTNTTCLPPVCWALVYRDGQGREPTTPLSCGVCFRAGWRVRQQSVQKGRKEQRSLGGCPLRGHDLGGSPQRGDRSRGLTKPGRKSQVFLGEQWLSSWSHSTCKAPEAASDHPWKRMTARSTELTGASKGAGKACLLTPAGPGRVQWEGHDMLKLLARRHSCLNRGGPSRPGRRPLFMSSPKPPLTFVLTMGRRVQVEGNKGRG